MSAENQGLESEREKQRDQQRLLIILEQSLTLNNSNGREDIIGRLHPDIRGNIHDRSTPRAHLLNIIKTCQNYPYGLRQLFDALELIEGQEANAVSLFREFLGTAPPIKSEPIVPRPKASSFDPDNVPLPGGTVDADSGFYIERPNVDQVAKQLIVKPRALLTIRGPRQSGKSSLLIRTLFHVQEANQLQHQLIDLQGMSADRLHSADSFARYLANELGDYFDLPAATVREQWDEERLPLENLTRFIEKKILPRLERPFIFAIEEADRMVAADFCTDFFGVVRSWYNKGASAIAWRKFNVILVIALDPSDLIQSAHQSPFNVGRTIYLDDFSLEQIAQLNQLHGDPLPTTHHPDFLALFGGQPYLTRLAFYELVHTPQPWASFAQNAHAETGVFGDHLRHQLHELKRAPVLLHTMRRILQREKTADTEALSALERAGIIREDENGLYRCRCELYTRYFSKRLG